jgi:hypothetical protein
MKKHGGRVLRRLRYGRLITDDGGRRGGCVRDGRSSGPRSQLLVWHDSKRSPPRRAMLLIRSSSVQSVQSNVSVDAKQHPSPFFSSGTHRLTR